MSNENYNNNTSDKDNYNYNGQLFVIFMKKASTYVSFCMPKMKKGEKNSKTKTLIHFFLRYFLKVKNKQVYLFPQMHKVPDLGIAEESMSNIFT